MAAHSIGCAMPNIAKKTDDDQIKTIALICNTGISSTRDYHSKEQFHRHARKFLRLLAEDIGLSSVDYDLRSNKGGPAVSGEVTLHSDRLYIQISHFGVTDILLRSCNGRHDYTGGKNVFVSLQDISHQGKYRSLVDLVRFTGYPERRDWIVPNDLDRAPAFGRQRL